MVTIRTILVTTDLSPFSLSGVEYATTMRLAFGARLHLLYVIEQGGKGSGPASNEPRTPEEALAGLRHLARKALGSETDALCAVRTGDPAEEICRYAREAGMDLIVMTTHGRTGFGRLLLGSVAERVVRNCAVPVLTVKPARIAESLLHGEDIERELHLC